MSYYFPKHLKLLLKPTMKSKTNCFLLFIFFIFRIVLFNALIPFYSLFNVNILHIFCISKLFIGF